MRPSTALFSLLATAASTPAALAAPIAADRIIDRSSRRAAVAAFADESGASGAVIDNSHYTPSDAIAPSAVLATPRPIETTYLMGLANSPARISTTARGARPEGAHAPARLYDALGKSEVVLVDAVAETETATPTAAAKASGSKADAVPAVAIGSDAKADASPSSAELPGSLMMEAMPRHRTHGAMVPCSYAQLRREYNDMMVISLVAVFLLVIVAVELWDSSEQSSDAEDALVGAIKLADDAAGEKRPLSVQAFPGATASSCRQPATDTGAP